MVVLGGEAVSYERGTPVWWVVEVPKGPKGPKGRLPSCVRQVRRDLEKTTPHCGLPRGFVSTGVTRN